MTEPAVSEPPESLPDEPPADAYEWAAQPAEDDPGQRDVGGPPAEFANEPDDAVPGVRSGEERHAS
jgi:hypothetical protein